jgi:hypothetical protein
MSAFAIYTGAAVKPGLAVINITVDGVEYIAEAPCGTSATDGAWVCSAVFPIGTTGRRVKFASGLHAPGENGENLAGLTYA